MYESYSLHIHLYSPAYTLIFTSATKKTHPPLSAWGQLCIWSVVIIMGFTPVNLQSFFPRRVFSVTQTLLTSVFLSILYVQMSLSFINTPVRFLPASRPTNMLTCANPPPHTIDENPSHNLPINTLTAHVWTRDICVALCVDIWEKNYQWIHSANSLENLMHIGMSVRWISVPGWKIC